MKNERQMKAKINGSLTHEATEKTYST